MVVIYMYNSVKVCGPTTMKPTFYKPVLVPFQGLTLTFQGKESVGLLTCEI